MWAQHMGALHTAEPYAVVMLALVPFVVLAIVLTVVSHRDRRTEPGDQRSGDT